MKRFLYVFLVLLIMLNTTITFNVNAHKSTNENKLAIVFTHDLHSHIDPFPLDGKSAGGFARIKTLVDGVKKEYNNTLLLDAGDFSMGTLFQTAFETDAIEYRMLGSLGYDATIFGNHEFDYGFDALQTMINVANNNSNYLPPILCANLNISESKLSAQDVEALNVKEYIIINKGNYKIAVFGLIGKDASELSTAGGLTFDDYIESARKVVDKIKSSHKPNMIICLSHGGTGETVDDEDISLAKEVPDIDLIISGHTHTTLNKPIIVGNTVIASCGEYGINVGKIVFDISKGNPSMDSYSLIPIDDSIDSNSDIQNEIDCLKGTINAYLNKFGYNSPDEVIAHSSFDFPEQSTMSDSLAEQPLGNLISDSYIHAIKQAEGKDHIPVDVAVAPVGVIRASIDKGDITVSQIFEISSLGIGNDGVSGYPLCSVYLTGKELWALAEIDASVSGLMSYAQLYCSGLGYSVNTNRMFLNRVYDCWLIDKDGKRIEIENDKLYRVVSGLTSAEMLATVKDKSFGLLKIAPKDSRGTQITNFDKFIVTDSNGNEVKEWKALADYVSSFPANANGISSIPLRYKNTEGRKNICDEFILSQIFINWNFISWIVFILITLLIGLIVFIVYKIVKKKKLKQHKQIDLE